MEWGVAKSADGVPIGYSVQGKGDITLVFIYGWSRDSMYWREQVSFFEKNYRIVTATSRGTATRDLGVPNAPSSGTPSPPTAATS
jgi:pimeloyl-ACP methyl ester carboxylesterase